MMIDKNMVHCCSMENNTQQEYYLFVPDGKINGIWVSIHGISINAKSHAVMFAPYALRGGFILVAPIFAKDHCPQYNIFGKADSGFRGDARLIEILDDVTRKTGISSEKIFLFGYSAGGQFAHRFIMNYPERIRAAVISSPGFFTFPDENVEYPFGLKDMGTQVGRKYDQKAFLALPILVNVGDKDVLRSENLLQREDVDRQQGMTRVERAKHWYDSIEKQTHALHVSADHRFKMLRGVGHGFEETMEKTDLGELTLSFFVDHI